MKIENMQHTKSLNTKALKKYANNITPRGMKNHCAIYVSDVAAQY